MDMINRMYYISMQVGCEDKSLIETMKNGKVIWVKINDQYDYFRLVKTALDVIMKMSKLDESLMNVLEDYRKRVEHYSWESLELANKGNFDINDFEKHVSLPYEYEVIEKYDLLKEICEGNFGDSDMGLIISNANPLRSISDLCKNVSVEGNALKRELITLWNVMIGHLQWVVNSGSSRAGSVMDYDIHELEFFHEMEQNLYDRVKNIAMSM